MKASHELTEQINQANLRRNEIERRLALINPRHPGKLRREALEAGDLEAVKALEAEHDALQIEHDCITARSSALIAKREQERAKEASAAIPSLIDGVRSATEAAEAARADFAHTLAKLDAAVRDLQQSRTMALRANLPAQGALPKLACDIEDLRTKSSQLTSRTFRFTPQELRGDLGIETGRPQPWAA